MRGTIKAGLGTVVGNAGEYLVVGELLRRGLIAALAPRNAPGVDVLVTNGRMSVNVRVKTKTDAANSWVWIRSKGEKGVIFKNLIGRGDFTVLVDLHDPDHLPEFYVLPTSELDALLREDFDKWLHQPGKRGKPHNPDNPMHRYGYSRDQRELLEKKYRNGWRQIADYLNGE